jgi:transcriptional regulator
VPTWNYVAVHATGTGTLVEDAERVRALLADLVHVYEGARPGAWSFEALAEDYVAGMQRGIVAFEIPIDRLEGKAKLSQNRDAVDQGRTRDALAASDDPVARAVASLMAGGPPR